MSRLKWVRIRPVQFGTSVDVMLGEGPPRIVTSDTGWVTVARPAQAGIVEWEGFEPVAQEVPIRIDGLKEDRSREAEVSLLRTIAGIGLRDPDGYSPSAVRINGPINFPQKRWIIAGIDEADIVRSSRDGHIRRYDATLQLIEYINPDQIRWRRRKKTRRSPAFYEVKEGDTLASIAQFLWGDKSKWRQLGNAQKPPLRDARRKLEAGTRLRVPGFSTSFLSGRVIK